MPSTRHPSPPGSEPQGLIDLFKRLEDRLVPFNERRQELWCSVCRYRDPLIDGGKLHADDCPLLMLNNALEQAIPPGAARCNLGLNVDMLDVDRLRNWAQCIQTFGADIGHWGSPKFVAETLIDIANRLDREIRDVGQLRALTLSLSSPPAVTDEGTTPPRSSRVAGVDE